MPSEMDDSKIDALGYSDEWTVLRGLSYLGLIKAICVMLALIEIAIAALIVKTVQDAWDHCK